MIPRLRFEPRRFWAALTARFRRRTRAAGPAVKGRMVGVISVKSPDPRFKEVLFVLREDCFSGEELNRQELLLQAKEAAGNYVNNLLPSARRRVPLMPLLLPAAGALLALVLTKLLSL